MKIHYILLLLVFISCSSDEENEVCNNQLGSNIDLLLTDSPFIVSNDINLNRNVLTSSDLLEITDAAGSLLSFNGDEVPASINIESLGEVNIDITFCVGSSNERTITETIVVVEDPEGNGGGSGELSFSEANVDSYRITSLPFPDKVDTYFEVDLDGVLMHQTSVVVFDGVSAISTVPDDLVVGEGPLTGFTENSVLTLRLFVDDNLFAEQVVTDITNLDQFGPVTDANGNTSFMDLEFGNSNENYGIRFSSFE